MALKTSNTQLRTALKNAFPGVKFSVRMSTGSASAWMRVSWSDGPTDSDVRAITRQYEGRRFNGMTDSYDDNGSALVAFDGDDLPRVLRYSCDGINTHRDHTTAGYRVAQHLISTDSYHKDLVLFTPEGDFAITGDPLPQSLYVDGHFHDYIYSPTQLAQAILRWVNLCSVTAPTR